MRKVYYIGYYSGLENPNNFFEFPSSNSKMDYIISVIRRLKFDLTIFSLGFPKEKSVLFNLSKRKKIDENTVYVFVSTVNLFLPFLNFISKIWLYFQVVILLLFRVKRNDVVLVYHSYLLNKVVNFCRFFANFKLIYEVEEIYQAAWQNSNKKIKHEIEALQNADAFIFVNDVMNQKCNHHNKPFIVCYGNYNNKKIAKSINYNIINIVYAGFIGGKDSDVMLAIDSAEFLPDNYFLNVLGYGTEENIKGMKNKIKEINVKCGKEIVEYFGCLSGDEYDNFLKKCQIGLSTRVLIDEYSDFTFPSKVLVYLSNNIIPVSSKINCILNSKVSESIVFYDENSPASVAEAIVSIDVNKYYSQDKDVITDLDSKFILDFNKLLN
ncbi:glycosyltransferase family protein [Flavobacterium bizetiae]|uniref:hypothetical protein n=2 Tax=Flavobacterium bizetiae TaxID=2704140 RepID=UPI00174D65AF|nr:hypothetical protein [Flavobacterium bizetiae]CAD5344724.1 hypothetical protein FLA105535_04732 [Flavobacterium bizetiae]CAD5350991.1 hypothetical protein FLA105534_04993 [Flavobacterium bizetiae]